MVFRVTRVNGNYQATADDLDLGIKDLPHIITYKHRHIHVESHGDPGYFDGTVNAAGTEFSGKLTEPQINATYPLTFKRTTNPPGSGRNISRGFLFPDPRQ